MSDTPCTGCYWRAASLISGVRTMCCYRPEFMPEPDYVDHRLPAAHVLATQCHGRLYGTVESRGRHGH